jgi:hypothetical protein
MNLLNTFIIWGLVFFAGVATFATGVFIHRGLYGPSVFLIALTVILWWAANALSGFNIGERIKQLWK